MREEGVSMVEGRWGRGKGRREMLRGERKREMGSEFIIFM